MKSVRLTFGALVAVATVGCGSSDTVVESEELFSASEESASVQGELSSSCPVGTTLEATTGVNLRSGPGTGYRVLHVIPGGARVKTVEHTAPQSGFYKINHNGTVGWSHGDYFKVVSYPSSSARDGAINRARSGVGFSYWWGKARWQPSGATSSNKGRCYGDCPDCSHSGSYGADCSGYAAKVWQVGYNNTRLDVESHPYGTYHFENERHGWHSVRRSDVKKADALVYNSGGAGHIVIYESGSPWGSPMVYEARGCRYGIVRNTRTDLSDAYVGRARDGY